MALDKTRERLALQTDLGGSYNHNATEVERDHSQGAVDKLIREFTLEETFGFTPGASLQ